MEFFGLDLFVCFYVKILIASYSLFIYFVNKIINDFAIFIGKSFFLFVACGIHQQQTKITAYWLLLSVFLIAYFTTDSKHLAKITTSASSFKRL